MPDYDVWTIQMRPNVVFHNGTALDAAAVKENLDAFVASPLTGAAFNNVEKTTVTGPLTVQVTTKTPWVAFPFYLTSQVGTIAEPSTLGKTAQNHPIGTGPFSFRRLGPERPLHREAQSQLLASESAVPRHDRVHTSHRSRLARRTRSNQDQ